MANKKAKGKGEINILRFMHITNVQTVAVVMIIMVIESAAMVVLVRVRS